MAWLQLSLAVADADVEHLSTVLTTAGALAVTWQDGADQPLYEPEPGTTPLWGCTEVQGLFSADVDRYSVTEAVRVAFGPLHCQWNEIAEQDWVRAWKNDCVPRCFGTRLWVCPHGTAAPAADAVVVSLDPGLAFGTGSHPTTALCLEWIDAADLQSAAVIDYGCGSGILAIAAAKLGAQAVWAVDNDPQALAATADNARANGVRERLHIVAPHELACRQVDVIIANILAAPLQALAADFAERVRAGGSLVLSGILTEQIAPLIDAYRPWFDFNLPVQNGEWVRLSGTRRT